MKAFLLLLIFVALIGGYAIKTRTELATMPEGGDIWTVRDTSGSAANLNCAAMTAKLKERLLDPSLRISKNSHLYFVTTGGTKSSFEPRLELDVQIPRVKSGLFGRKNTMYDEFLAGIEKHCAAWPEAEGSAIVRTVEIVIQQMKSRNCGPKRLCELILMTDGLENGNREVARYLYNKNPNATPPLMLDNTMAHKSTWCGYEQMGLGSGPIDNAQTIIDRFGAMFTKPVLMEPYCTDPKQAIQARGH